LRILSVDVRVRLGANMQFRLLNLQWYLVIANPDTNHSANLLTLMVTVSGNPNPANPTTK